MIRQEETYHEEDVNWNISRKKFIQSLFILGAASQLPFLSSCEERKSYEINFDTTPLTKNQTKTLQQVLITLFPEDGNGPSALDVNADKYIIWVLNDSNLDPRENAFIIEKLNQFEQFIKTKYQSIFSDLNESKQYESIESVSNEKWGKKWISRLLTLIFEALLLDPIYGVNPDEIGWKWLQHDSGVPRPDNRTSYPSIFSINEV